MKFDNKKLTGIDWTAIAESMNNKGFAVIPDFLNHEACDQLVNDYNQPELYRKTVVMERYRFGLGEYKYFNYPLPGLIQSIRESVYPSLVPIANGWMKDLKMETQFPGTLAELQELCHSNGQTKPTPLILKYGKGGYNTMHQDLYGIVFFPIQLVLFLDQVNIDYAGGEFVMMEQVPRAQSKSMVLQPNKGDILLFTTSFRPVRGSKGFYRVNMKHGVSEVQSGNRHTLGIIFHDATS